MQVLDLLARIVVRIWRAGCIIINHEHIADLFKRHYAKAPGRHPLVGEEISGEIRRCWSVAAPQSGG